MKENHHLPNSSHKGKSEILKWFRSRNDIKSIFDVGAGAATYPKLLAPIDYFWIGCEIFEPYVKRFELKKYYDELLIADITKIDLWIADCIIFGDVLEHLPEESVRKLIRKAEAEYKHVVVSIPVDSKQDEVVNNNQFEKHKSVWSAKELDLLFPRSFHIRKLIDDIYIFIK